MKNTMLKRPLALLTAIVIMLTAVNCAFLFASADDIEEETDISSLLSSGDNWVSSWKTEAGENLGVSFASNNATISSNAVAIATKKAFSDGKLVVNVYTSGKNNIIGMAIRTDREATGANTSSQGYYCTIDMFGNAVSVKKKTADYFESGVWAKEIVKESVDASYLSCLKTGTGASVEVYTNIEDSTKIRIIIKVNGIEIINFLDDGVTSGPAITSPGAITLQAAVNSGSIETVFSSSPVPTFPAVNTEKYIDLYEEFSLKNLTSLNYFPAIQTIKNTDGTFSKSLNSGLLMPGCTNWGAYLWTEEKFDFGKSIRFKASADPARNGIIIGINVKNISKSNYTPWNCPGMYITVTSSAVQLTKSISGTPDEYNASKKAYSLTSNGINGAEEHEYELGTYDKKDKTYLYVRVDGIKVIETETEKMSGKGSMYIYKESAVDTITAVTTELYPDEIPPVFPTVDTSKYIDLYTALDVENLTTTSGYSPNILTKKLDDGTYTKIMSTGMVEEPNWGLTAWTKEIYDPSLALRFKAKLGENGNMYIGTAVQDLGRNPGEYDPWSRKGYYLLLSESLIMLTKNLDGSGWDAGAVRINPAELQIDMKAEHIYQIGTYSIGKKMYLYLFVDGIKIAETEVTAFDKTGAVYITKNTNDILTAVPYTPEWKPFEGDDTAPETELKNPVIDGYINFPELVKSKYFWSITDLTGADFSNDAINLHKNAVIMSTNNIYSNEKLKFNINTNGIKTVSNIGLRIENGKLSSESAAYGYYIMLDGIEGVAYVKKKTADFNDNGWPKFLSWRAWKSTPAMEALLTGAVVEASATEENGNIRILLKINGVEVINYLDDGKDPNDASVPTGRPITDSGNLQLSSSVYTEDQKINTVFSPVDLSFDSEQLSVIGGNLYDASGKPIADATITLNPLGLTTVTDDKGYYFFEYIVPGNYSIEYNGAAAELTIAANASQYYKTVFSGSKLTLTKIDTSKYFDLYSQFISLNNFKLPLANRVAPRLKSGILKTGTELNPDWDSMLISNKEFDFTNTVVFFKQKMNYGLTNPPVLSFGIAASGKSNDYFGNGCYSAWEGDTMYYYSIYGTTVKIAKSYNGTVKELQVASLELDPQNYESVDIGFALKKINDNTVHISLMMQYPDTEEPITVLTVEDSGNVFFKGNLYIDARSTEITPIIPENADKWIPEEPGSVKPLIFNGLTIKSTSNDITVARNVVSLNESFSVIDLMSSIMPSISGPEIAVKDAYGKDVSDIFGLAPGNIIQITYGGKTVETYAIRQYYDSSCYGDIFTLTSGRGDKFADLSAEVDKKNNFGYLILIIAAAVVIAGATTVVILYKKKIIKFPMKKA